MEFTINDFAYNLRDYRKSVDSFKFIIVPFVDN